MLAHALNPFNTGMKSERIIIASFRWIHWVYVKPQNIVFYDDYWPFVRCLIIHISVFIATFTPFEILFIASSTVSTVSTSLTHCCGGNIIRLLESLLSSISPSTICNITVEPNDKLQLSIFISCSICNEKHYCLQDICQPYWIHAYKGCFKLVLTINIPTISQNHTTILFPNRLRLYILVTSTLIKPT